jgi:hypothetical protein
LVALLWLASVGHAQGLGGALGLGGPVGFGGSVGLATDDVFRGLTQNNGQPSPQGDLHAMAGPW